MNSEDLAYAGVVEQAALVRARELSAPELVESQLRRIERLQPALNCFTRVLGERALADAADAQRRLEDGDPAPLLGVPVAVKDNTDVAGVVTSHGTGAVDSPAITDSEPVRRLRTAGAVIVGKTTLPELAMWGHFTASSTWGVTRNPWNRDRSPGGSSGGSAAAVAAGMVAGALGSDGGASIRVPAAMCGIFGLKPQRGRVSMLPDRDHWYGMTQFGGLARSVLDAAVLDDVLSDRDMFAAAARAEPRKLRIAVSMKPSLPTRLHPGCRAAVERTADLLRSLGHDVREREQRWGFLFPTVIPRYLCGVRDDAARLEHAERLERRSRTIAGIGARVGGRPLRRSLAREATVSARLNAILEDHDVLLTPLIAQPPPRADSWDGKGAFATFDAMRPYVAYTGVWNYTGQPAAAVPAGFEDGLPVAVQLVGRPDDEATLVSLAAQLERARPWADRRPPLD